MRERERACVRERECVCVREREREREVACVYTFIALISVFISAFIKR